MSVALCCMSHSPLLTLPGPPDELIQDVQSAIGRARAVVEEYDPELVVIFAPDHYNGFFYRLMPPFCVGTQAQGVGDYGTSTAALDIPQDIAHGCLQAAWDAGVDLSISTAMDVDHGTVQPLDMLFGTADAVPTVPIFINSVAVPLGPVKRVRLLGDAIGQYLARLDKRVLVIGSGGLSHDPPVPTLATAPPQALDRIVKGVPITSEQRMARQTAVIDAAAEFAAGESNLQPLNPAWDAHALELFDAGNLEEFDGWSNEWMEQEAGHSSHETRTWIAAFAAMAASGAYETGSRYYRAAPELLAGFAVRTASTR